MAVVPFEGKKGEIIATAQYYRYQRFNATNLATKVSLCSEHDCTLLGHQYKAYPVHTLHSRYNKGPCPRASFRKRNSIGAGFKFIRPTEMLLVGNEVMCHVALQDLHSTTVTSYYRVSVCTPPGRSSLHFGTVPPGRELVGLLWPSTADRHAASLQMPSVTLLSAACSFSYSAISRLTSCVAPVHNITCR